ncbi:MAG: YhcH/YjgK/YiaL family protein [Ignavibacteriales bacterium]|nr:YhcH/YjgK/YiaL family protein [Ignavibacteriales bacterium]
MILDHLSRAEKYFNMHSSFKHAFDYLKSTDLRSLPLGRTDIEGDDVYIIIATDETGNERRKLETHRSYIDIQLPIEGSFPLEWHDSDSCRNISQEYSPDNDVMLYNDPPLFTVHLIPDMFAVLFPEDAHAPQPPMTRTKKAIVKVAV